MTKPLMQSCYNLVLSFTHPGYHSSRDWWKADCELYDALSQQCDLHPLKDMGWQMRSGPLAVDAKVSLYGETLINVSLVAPEALPREKVIDEAMRNPAWVLIHSWLSEHAPEVFDQIAA